MEKVTVYYDAAGETLTVWLGNPESEATCEEVGDDVVLMKDASGHMIGMEKLNVRLAPGARGIVVEVIPSLAAATPA